MNLRSCFGLISVVILAIAFFSCETFCGPIDTVLVRLADLTGDAVSDSMLLHIQAKSFHSPFKWTLTVRSNHKTIYSDRSDDTRLEEMFTDEFFPGTTSYEQAKTEYYFQNFIGLRVSRDIDFGKPSEVLMKRSVNTVYFWTKKYLIESCNLSSAKSGLIAERVRKRLLAKKLLILSHTDGIVQSSLPYVFVPEVGKMIPIYND